MHKHDEHGNCCNGLQGLGRRGFLSLATLTAGVSLLSPLLPRSAQAGSVDTLLLTCMDYRLTYEVAAYMDSRNLRHQYDHIVLAGASLGAITNLKPDWGHEFWDHVAVAKELHHIKKIMVIDHRDCGAYKVFLGEDYGKERDKETAVHSDTLRKLAAMVKERHPDLQVELMLMDLEGKVEPVAATA